MNGLSAKDSSLKCYLTRDRYILYPTKYSCFGAEDRHASKSQMVMRDLRIALFEFCIS
jgi:hypothetical protein